MGWYLSGVGVPVAAIPPVQGVDHITCNKRAERDVFIV